LTLFFVDCCDGSDEYNGIADCSDKCAAVAAHEAAAEAQQQKIYLEGSIKFEEYATIGEQGVEALQQEKEEHQALLVQKEAVLADATKRKDTQEELENAERKILRQEGEQGVYEVLGLMKLDVEQLRSLVVKIARTKPKESDDAAPDGHREVVLDATNSLLTELASENTVDPIGEWRTAKEEAKEREKEEAKKAGLGAEEVGTTVEASGGSTGEEGTGAVADAEQEEEEDDESSGDEEATNLDAEPELTNEEVLKEVLGAGTYDSELTAAEEAREAHRNAEEEHSETQRKATLVDTAIR
jgi:hypothetical protein